MERLLDVKDAAEFLNVSEMTIRRWTTSGKLRCYRLGGKRERRFHMRELEEFLQGLQSDRLKPLGVGGHRCLTVRT
jgi:transcriptional repressor of dcmA and dcmR